MWFLRRRYKMKSAPTTATTINALLPVKIPNAKNKIAGKIYKSSLFLLKVKQKYKDKVKAIDK